MYLPCGLVLPEPSMARWESGTGDSSRWVKHQLCGFDRKWKLISCTAKVYVLYCLVKTQENGKTQD